VKPASAKAKGRELQQFIAKLIVRSFPELSDDDAVSRPMGSGGCDIMMSPLAQRLFPISTECKNHVIEPGVSALNQSIANRYAGTIPVVCWKPRRRGMAESLCIMRYEDLIKLVKRLRAEGEQRTEGDI